MSTYSELHTAWETKAEKLAEAEYEVERQHGEILELNGRLADALETAAIADRLSAAITSAVADLRVIEEVPLGQLEDALKAIADRLADQNGERY